MTRPERLALLERAGDAPPLTQQAELLGLSRASLYYHPAGPKPSEITLKHRIDEIYTASPFYGSRRMAAVLRREGHEISRQRVQGYMREMGIMAIYPGPNVSRRDLTHRVYPYLLRGLEAARPNHVWGIDITSSRLLAGWLYVVAILDWYSRSGVSWELNDSLEIGFVLAAVTACARGGAAGDFQLGSREPFHQPPIHCAA